MVDVALAFLLSVTSLIPAFAHSASSLALPGTAAAEVQEAPASPAPDPAEPPAPDPERIQPVDPAATYRLRCSGCHAEDGRGVSGTIPPLRDSDYLRADLRRAIRGVLRGLQGEIVVNGASYDSAMPAQSSVSDEEIAAALTHVLSWNGETEPVSAALVADVRASTEGVAEITAGPCGSACRSKGGAGCGMSKAASCGAGTTGCCTPGLMRRHRHGRAW